MRDLISEELKHVYGAGCDKSGSPSKGDNKGGASKSKGDSKGASKGASSGGTHVTPPPTH